MDGGAGGALVGPRPRESSPDGNIDWFGVKRATDWHTDSPYEEVPPRLAILHAKEVPSDKGGTMFADMRAAYDGLDDAMKAPAGGPGRAARPA